MPNAWELISIVVNIALVIGQGVLHRQAKKVAAQARKIDTLEKDLKSAAKEQVKQFLDSETGELRLSMGMLRKEMDSQRERLSAGDGEFKEIEQKAFEQRLEVLRELRDMHRQLATREDLVALTQKIDGCVSNVARLQALSERRR